MELIDVPVSQLSEAPWNPRKQFDPAKLDELAESIRAQGVLEPLIVRPITPDALRINDPMCYEIVAGHRRARAAERIGRHLPVPCIVRKLSDTQALEIAIIENGQRADVHPIEEAEAIERLMLLDQAYTAEAVAAKLGVHVTTVNRKLRLLKLADVCRAAYQANAITAAHAERLAKLPADQQMQALENCFSPLLAWEDETTDVDEAEPGETFTASLIRRGRWAQLADAVAPIGELDEWLKLNARADVHDDGAKQQILSALTDADIAALSDKVEDDTNIVGQLAQLSACDDFNFGRVEADAAHVLHRDEWKEVASTGGRCDRTKKGVIVHGGPLRVVDFCERSKKCAQHWPELQPKPKTAPADDDTDASKERPQWQIDQERRDAARAEWEAIRPAARLAVADQVAGLKFSAALVATVLGQQKVAIVKREFGVTLTEKTATTVLALSTVQDWDRQGFEVSTKPLGFKLAQWEKEQKAAAKKSAKTTKPTKAAKAKKGGKR